MSEIGERLPHIRFISTQLPAGFPPEVRHFFGGLCNIAFSRLFELMDQVGHRPLKSQFCLQLTTAFCRILLMGEFVFHVDPHPRSFRNSGSQVRSSQQLLILMDGLDVWSIPACNILYVYPHTIIRTVMYAQGNNTRSIYEPIIN